MKFDDGIPAIPLWIDGHAWFGVFEDFIDIREADGQVHFRVPKCGADEVANALASACDLQPTWGEALELRAQRVAELAALLDQFGGDFARLIARETGKTPEAARDEVAAAAAQLRGAACVAGGGSVQAVFADASAPLASAAAGLAAAWAAGDAAVVLSDARAPSVLFALAELSARAEFPGGAFCLVHGDAATRQALQQALGG